MTSSLQVSYRAHVHNTILLRKYRADGCCDLCGEVTGDSILFRGKRICAACRKELAKL